MKFIQKWNKKIYRDDDGEFIGGGLNDEAFWSEFKIKSGPKFEAECWSHIPERWADEVRKLIGTVQNELGERISFKQIKEKFCNLVIYYDYRDSDAKTRTDELIKECINKLIEQGVYPPKQGEKNE